MSDQNMKVVPKAAGGRPARISREQIIQEARQLGVGELSFSRLAERLGVRDSAIYHRFKSREELLNALAMELAGEFSLAPINPKRWRPWLKDTALHFFDFLVANPVVLEVSNWRGLEQFGIPIGEAAMEAMTVAGHSKIDAGRAWFVVSHMAYAQARLITDLTRAGPMLSRIDEQSSSVPAPLTHAYQTRFGSDPRGLLEDSLHWVVSAMPQPRS